VLISGVALAGDPLSATVTVDTLPNGLVVLLSEDHRTDRVALHLTYGVGSRDEKEGEKGCAHLFEHLMFEGSAHAPANTFDEWLTAAGGSNNAYTSEDVTAYHEIFPSGAVELALFLESDRMAFLDAALDETNLANQQLVVLQERAEGYAEPNGRDWDALGRLVWPERHPYHHPVIGTVADVEGFTIDRVRSFWRRHYAPSNAVLALVGNFETEPTLALVRKWFSDVPDTGLEAAVRMTEPPQPAVGSNRGLLEDDVEERSMILAWPAVPIGHPDEPALDVLANVLSNGRGTRLDDALYYDKQLTSSIAAFTLFSELGGQFLVTASTPDRTLEQVRVAVDKQLTKVVSAPPTAAEVDRARRAIRGWILDAIERPEGLAEQLVGCWRRTGTADCLPAEWARYEAVTPEQVVRVARTYLVGREPSALSTVPRGQSDAALEGSVPVELP
jgi:zinc protease